MKLSRAICKQHYYEVENFSREKRNYSKKGAKKEFNRIISEWKKDFKVDCSSLSEYHLKLAKKGFKRWANFYIGRLKRLRWINETEEKLLRRRLL